VLGPTVAKRLFAKLVEAEPPTTEDRLGRPIIGPCLLWSGAIDADGYGVIWDSSIRNNRKVHRVAYEIARGSPPVGVTDHLCRVRRCGAAAHLEDVSNAQNIARGDVSLVNGARTHCPRGHPYDETNTRRTKTYNGYGAEGRECRACDRERWRAANGVPVDAPLRADRPTCKNGHPWTEENTYWVRRSKDDATLRRQCRTCRQDRAARR
jgi:hypothetical protein